MIDMANLYKLQTAFQNVMASLLEVDQKQAIEAFVEQVCDVEVLIRKIGVETIKETLGDWFQPEEIFTHEELAEWAHAHLDEPTDDEYDFDMPWSMLTDE
jgi:hypothetical protein